MPHRRAQALIGQPDLRGPKFVRYVEDAAGRALYSAPSRSWRAFPCPDGTQSPNGRQRVPKPTDGADQTVLFLVAPLH